MPDHRMMPRSGQTCQGTILKAAATLLPHCCADHQCRDFAARLSTRGCAPDASERRYSGAGRLAHERTCPDGLKNAMGSATFTHMRGLNHCSDALRIEGPTSFIDTLI